MLMSRNFYALTFLAASLWGTGTVRADIVDNYTMDFNTEISTTDHSFKVGSGWGHQVEKYSDYYDEYYVSYTYAATEGVDGSGALKVGSQSLGDGYATKDVNDLLVTPAVTGASSIYVKRASSYSTGTIKFYKVTKSGSTYTKGDEIEVTMPTLSTDEYVKVEIPEQKGTLIGIRANNVYIDNFSADKADVVLAKSMKITSVKYTGPTNNKPDCDTEGKFTVSYTVTVQNTGDVELTEGMKGYSLSVVNYSKENAEVFSHPMTETLAVGASTTVDIAGTVDYAVYPGRNRYDVRENLDSVSSYGAWLEPTPYKAILEMRDNDGTMANGEKTYALGLVNAGAEQSVSIRNNGAAPLQVTSVTVPNGFKSNIDKAFTLEAHGDTTLTVTLSATEPGTYSGDVVVATEGNDDFKFAVSATLIDPNKFFADFEDEKIPEGCIAGDNWKVSQRDFLSNGNAYLLEHSSRSGETMFITPLLNVTEGDVLSFDAAQSSAGVSYSCYLNVYYSSDRQHWTLAKTIQSSELASTRANYNYWFGKLTPCTVDNIPAGNYYIGFGSVYVSLDNIYGFEKVEVAHDLMLDGSKIPGKATVNNEYTATASLKNVNVKAEEAGSYTAKLYVDEKEVATAEAVAIENGATVEYTFTYTPHEVGTAKTYILFKNNNEEFTISTDTIDVVVKAESAEKPATIGSGDYAGNGYNVPFKWYDANVKEACADMLYTPRMLTAFGLKAGDKIGSITYTGKNIDYGAKEISELNLYAYVGMVDSASVVRAEGLDDMQKVTLYENESVSFTPGDILETVISLNEPIVWDGTSTIRVYTSIHGSKYTKFDYAYDSNYKNAWTAQNYSGSVTSTSYWSNYNIPVAVFGLVQEPSTVSGKVTCGEQAIADATVILTSDNVIYSGKTDAEGAYSVPVIQTDKTYVLTVTADGYKDYTEENISLAESIEKNISLKKSNVTVTGKVTYRGAALSGATVSLTNGEDKVFTATTDDEGAYTVENVAADLKYAVKVTADKFTSYVSTDSVEITDDTTLDDIAMYREKVTIKGSVKWGNTAVADAKVVYKHATEELSATTDGEGNYEIADVVPDQKFALTVKAVDFEDYAEDDSVEVADNMEKNISLTIKPIEVAVAGNGFTTFSAARAIDFSKTEGVKAYVVTEVKDNYTVLAEVTAVPANTGVILQAAAGKYSVVPVEAADAVEKNLLVATADDYTLAAADEGKNWTLTEQGENTVFTSKAGATVAKGQAYLAYESEESVIYLSEADGIHTIGTAVSNGLNLNAPMYNLAGQKVDSDYKGVVIQNGKKYNKK